MANDLLSNFAVASNRFSHVLYNERTQQFERAGKRHAIATFFGSANAISKNEITIAKIKEAFESELKEMEHIRGLGESTNHLFSSVKTNSRIESKAVNAILMEFHKNTKSNLETLRLHKEMAVSKMCDTIGENLFMDSSPYHDARINNILKAVAMQHLDAALSNMDMKSAISTLKDWNTMESGGDASSPVAKAFSDFADFIVGVNTDETLRKTFAGLLSRVVSDESPRLAQMVCQEMQSAACLHVTNLQYNVSSDWTEAMNERLAQLIANMDNEASSLNVLKGMDIFPIKQETYTVALDVCKAVKNMPELEKWLSRQHPDSRLTYAAAIVESLERFDNSDDPILLRKLMNASDEIGRLYADDKLTLESIYRALEGKNARLPDGFDLDKSGVGKVTDDVRYFFRDRAIAEFSGLFPKGPNVKESVVGARLMVNLGCSPSIAHWIVEGFSNVDLAHFSDEQLKMFMSLTRQEMETLDRLAGFEIAIGTDAQELHKQIADEKSVVRRFMSYPELSMDFRAYMQARELFRNFDAKFAELVNGNGLVNIKESTKWAVERFVFEDLAMQVGKGGTLPDARTFADGITADNQFVRFLEKSFIRPNLAWTLFGLAPEFRVPILSALRTYDTYDNVYLVTRLVSNKDKLCGLYDKSIKTETPLTKEEIFHIVMGKSAKFDPKVHGTCRCWDDIMHSGPELMLEEHGITMEENGKLYARKHDLSLDLFGKYDISQKAISDFVFPTDADDEITFKHSEYTSRSVAMVVNAMDKGIEGAREQFDKDYKRIIPDRCEMKFNLPEGTVHFRKSSDDCGPAQNQRNEKGIYEAVIDICGALHLKQIENLLMVLSQAFELDLYAPFIAFGLNPADTTTGLSKSFEISRNGKDGSISVHVTDMGISSVKFDWGITIYTDGTHTVADMVASRNPDCDGVML